ncbi:MAG: MFS transporter [Desulfobulbaceae bacterium]|nr:MFS transporter [Desulfobulbaceae bacterium]
MSDRKGKWLIFLVVASGVFLSTLDSSMVNIALPVIMAEFKTPLHKTEWVVLAYLVTISTTLLFWGHVSDRLGRSKFYGFGFLVFGAGSLGCALSSTLSMLIACRFFQALGAAMMMANGPAIIRETFPPEKLGRSMGLVGIPVSLGLMTGPVLGGYVIEFFSWRTLFLLSLPISFTLGIAARFILPSRPGIPSPHPFDWSGALLWSGLLVILSLAFTQASAPEMSWVKAVAAFGLLVATLYCFVRVELKAQEPVLPLSLLKKRYFTIGIVSALLSFLILFSVLILMPFYLDRVLGLVPSAIGLTMMVIPLSALLVAPVAGWLSDYVGAKILSTLGLLCSTAGLLLLATLSPETSPFAVAARLICFGVGQATFLSPNSASVLSRMAKKNSGTAAALLATARNVGMMLGISLAGFLFSSFYREITGGLDLAHFVPGFEAEFCRALRISFLVIAGAGVASVVLSWQRPVFSGRN